MITGSRSNEGFGTKQYRANEKEPPASDKMLKRPSPVRDAGCASIFPTSRTAISMGQSCFYSVARNNKRRLGCCWLRKAKGQKHTHTNPAGAALAPQRSSKASPTRRVSSGMLPFPSLDCTKRQLFPAPPCLRHPKQMKCSPPPLFPLPFTFLYAPRSLPKASGDGRSRPRGLWRKKPPRRKSASRRRQEEMARPPKPRGRRPCVWRRCEESKRGSPGNHAGCEAIGPFASAASASSFSTNKSRREKGSCFAGRFSVFPSQVNRRRCLPPCAVRKATRVASQD